MATARALCETAGMPKRPVGRPLSADGRTLLANSILRTQLAETERQVEQLRAALRRQLEISGAERRARELAERSREEALRQCARARLPALEPL